MDLIWEKFTEWLKELLVGGIMDNLTGLFDNVNAKVAEAAGHIGSTPQAWNANIYSMIRSLSDNLILPIAGVILAFVMTLELIQLIADRNNLHDIDTWVFFRWVFKTAAAVLIGSSGAFITGTGLGSNIMFAQMHIDAAASLGMNPITIFAGQNAGASLGNLICPNNTVAACATVDAIGRENEVMKHTLRAFAIVLALYMVLAMLYTCVLFPNYGM